MTIPIPPDEALIRAAEAHIENIYSLRAVATLAAKQAAEQAVKEAVLRIDHWAQAECGYYEDQGGRAMLRRDFPSAFTPTPPKEQTDMGNAVSSAAVKDFAERPSPDPATVRLDEATVRACIEAIKKQQRDCQDVGVKLSHGGTVRVLESLLPKPTPAPEPERYVTLAEVEKILDGYGNGTRMVTGPVRNSIMVYLREWAAKRGPMLTPEQAEEAARKCLGWMESPDPTLLAALRLAAKQGGAA